MLSVTPLTADSYPICVITKGKKLKETVFFTEPSKNFSKQKVPFEKQIEKYLDQEASGFTLSEDYSFEMVPTIGAVVQDKKTIPAEKNPRFVNYYLSASNSGKSYQIAAICRRYLQMWPDNLIAYASANNIADDKNYDDIRDKIKEVDVINLESTINFNSPEYHNSLWIFDDCDGGFSLSMEDLDERLTEEEVDKLSVTEKRKAAKMLQEKCETASVWISGSIKSFMTNGRKFAISLCVVGHKPFKGAYENLIVNEGNGVVLFPASMRKNVLHKFLMQKLDFGKEDARSILYDHDWYQYDFLYVSHRTSTPFVITNSMIKLFK